MMTRFFPLLLLFVLAAIASAQTHARAHDDSHAVAIPGQLVVKLSEQSSKPVDDALRLLSSLSPTLGRITARSWLQPAILNLGSRAAKRAAVPRGLDRIVVIFYTASVEPHVAAAKASSIAGVSYAEPVYRREISTRPNDPRITEQWYLD